MKFTDLFDYDDGKLFWKRNRKRADHPQSTGYRRTLIKQKQYYTHRIIWEMFHGEIPEGYMIDHINRVRDDNRIENLRLVTRAENQFNRGAKGYFYNKVLSKWQAAISSGKKKVHLGVFATQEEARASYLKAKSTLHVYGG